MSEDRQLQAIHLILDFKLISRVFQEIGHAIRAGDPRINRIDVSKLDFLAREDLGGNMHIRSGKLNGSTSFTIYNMHYVNFRIQV